MSDMTMGGTGRAKRATSLVAVVAGIAQLAVGFFTFSAIGLISVPVWAIVLLAALWLAGAVVLVRNGRHAPLVAVAVPVVNALLLWGIVAAGGAWLGWNA
jgi:hypothetical protein